jgi:hypothetical protein
MDIPRTQSGYTTLIAVLIVGAIGTIITTSLLDTGLNSTRMSTTQEFAALSRALNQQCLEKSLLTVYNQNTFVGTITDTTDYGACTSTVTNQDSSTKIITTTSTVNTIIKVTSAQISNSNPITISMWKEQP